MPWADARTLPGNPVPNKPKRKLGSRDEPAVDPAAVLAELVSEVARAVARVLGVGGSIQFGSTRDRKALLIRAWVAGDVYEDYVKSVAELVATLEALDDVVEGATHRDPTPLNGRAVRGS
jgi:hypothetical protein